MISVEFTFDGPAMWGYTQRRSADRAFRICLIDIAWLQIKITRRTRND